MPYEGCLFYSWKSLDWGSQKSSGVTFQVVEYFSAFACLVWCRRLLWWKVWEKSVSSQQCKWCRNSLEGGGFLSWIDNPWHNFSLTWVSSWSWTLSFYPLKFLHGFGILMTLQSIRTWQHLDDPAVNPTAKCSVTCFGFVLPQTKMTWSLRPETFTHENWFQRHNLVIWSSKSNRNLRVPGFGSRIFWYQVYEFPCWRSRIRTRNTDELSWVAALDFSYEGVGPKLLSGN